jgi:predicted glycosyltransferase
MDATRTERAVMVSLSRGAQYLLELARLAPERLAGAAFIGPMFPYTPSHWSLLLHPRAFSALFQRQAPAYRWWGRMNAAHWRSDYPQFAEWFISRCFPEPHSTKGIDDGVEWALDTDPETLIATAGGGIHRERSALRELARNLEVPVLVVHGDRDKITPPRDGRALARLADGRLEVVRGAGHFPHARKPVQVNLALRDFSEEAFGRPRTPRDPTVHHSDGRPRALYISSPIGLGHAQRDVAIARELRRLHPDLQIDWLAQDPVTRVLAAEGERIHPASAHLANESRHIESESAEHDLHCFHALRRMDEILAANFMLFHDVIRDERYDLWIGDEAWELDYYLHENPREKRVPFAWLTDFVGFLPMRDGDEREGFLTADYNADMVDHVAHHPEVRDLALFVGNPEDIVPDRLGPELPLIRDWTESHFDFTGYVSGFDPADLGERSKLRADLGFGDDERVCIVTVGGSGVGADLLRRVIAAHPQAKERVPELRMIVVAGPRIDPESLPSHAGLEVVPYVHNLYRHLAACDVAVVQGGLTTSMELTAQKRPFLYFPLRHHFEQNFHVRHRLERYGAGRRMDFDDSPPERIAEAIAQELAREVDYRDVEVDGAARAARRVAELL